jgi:hypothetical protein
VPSTWLGSTFSSSRLDGFRRLDVAFFDDRDDVVTVNRVAFLRAKLSDRAVNGRRYFQHDLVGFQVNEVFIAVNGVARALVPAGDGCVLHGLGQNGYFYFNRHETDSIADSSVVGMIASSTNCCCSSMWRVK